MRPRIIAALLGCGFFLGAGSPALPCSLCPGQNAHTLRQDAALAKLVLFGTLANPRLNVGRDGVSTNGATDLHIEAVLKSDPILGNRKVIELPRYQPVDAKTPPKFLVFCDVFNGKLDPYRGTLVKSPAVVEYLKGALAQEAKNKTPLEYFFAYLDHREPEIAADAFLEFAKAGDAEVGQVAAKLSPAKLRAWLQDSQTPPDRLSIYAFLLGGSGGDQDAAVLRRLLEKPTERTANALGGLLAGYIMLKPREGWDLAVTMLRDESRPFIERFSLLGALRFYRGWKPKDTETQILRGLAVLLPQGDIADLAVEDLRRWQLWNLTGEVLAQYGKKNHDAPIMRRAIIRYAMTCPRPEAQRFLEELKKKDPELYGDVRESLQFEKK